MKHWFVKTVIEMLPSLEKAGLITQHNVKEDAAAQTVAIDFRTKDAIFKIRATRGSTRVLNFVEGASHRFDGALIQKFGSLSALVGNAGIASFEPAAV